jgi:hypothetical protein
VKTTFDLPDPLLRKAKALAAEQGRPLRDLVAEALGEKLDSPAGGAVGSTEAREGRREAWERWKTRLERLPDGSWFNPEGVEEESFFLSVDEARRESWASRGPFAT